MSVPFKFVLAALALLVGTAGLTLLHLENRRLQRSLIAMATRAPEVTRLGEDNRRLERLLADHRQGANSARARARRDVEQIRAEIATLEKKAEEQHAVRAAVIARDEAAIEGNRDPRQGPTRIEYFQNRGQATPSAALETLAWAALKGDDATLAEVTALNSAVRAKADALISTLPTDDRAKWTPEKLGQLWFKGLFTEMPAVQIVSETIVGADEAIVRLRLPIRGDEENLALRLTPAGWKVLVPSAAIDHLEKKIHPAK